MRRLKTASIGLVAAAVLGGCGPLNKGSTASQVADLIVDLTTGSTQTAPTAAPPLSPEEVRANPGKFMRVNIRNRNRWDTMIQAGENGTRTTWVDSENNSVTVDGGIVVASRGLMGDLIAADVAEVRAALRRGGGNALRRHDFLKDQDGISTELLQCRIVSQGSETIERLQTRRKTVKFEEKCAGDSLEFTNVYWLNDAGSVIRSLQAVSPDAGYLQIDVF
ncbi:YjbF family lipoprotein [Yoonia sp. SS1-5]|uniref:YjbF family lipoprotein n=1 Tax=Yoonia rhodophyticola TaxID=3137370 RepID=A0AAN0NJD7_9RHOB